MADTMQRTAGIGPRAAASPVQAIPNAPARESQVSTGAHLPQQPEVTVPEKRAETPAQPAMRDEAYQAYQILHFGFTVAPIAAGLDKFFGVLTNWDQYLSPLANRLAMGHGHGFMLVAGVVEIVAGIGVALRPRVFGYVVAAWLGAIILNLVSIPGYYDIALRDLGLALGALALARLAGYFHRS